MKNKSITFAANAPSSILLNTKRSSYFYGYLAVICKDIRLSTPRGLLHLCCNLNLAVREAIAFLILFTLIFHHEMPSSMKNQSKGNNSILALTYDYESVISTLRNQFKIEMDAKNKAYAFILHNGLFNEFSEFCKATSGRDPHKLCLTILAEQV